MRYLDMMFVRLQTSWYSLEKEESGQTLIEYALIISVIGVGTIGALVFFGDSIKGLFSDAGSSLP